MLFNEDELVLTCVHYLCVFFTSALRLGPIFSMKLCMCSLEVKNKHFFMPLTHNQTVILICTHTLNTKYISAHKGEIPVSRQLFPRHVLIAFYIGQTQITLYLIQTTVEFDGEV